MPERVAIIGSQDYAAYCPNGWYPILDYLRQNLTPDAVLLVARSCIIGRFVADYTLHPPIQHQVEFYTKADELVRDMELPREHAAAASARRMVGDCDRLVAFWNASYEDVDKSVFSASKETALLLGFAMRAKKPVTVFDASGREMNSAEAFALARLAHAEDPERWRAKEYRHALPAIFMDGEVLPPLQARVPCRRFPYYLSQGATIQ